MITRRDIVVATAAVCATVAVVTLAQSSDKPVMRSGVFQWKDLPVEQKPTGERRQVFDAPTATLDRLESHVTTVNPGAALHAAHRHVEEEVMIVREGTIESVQNGRTNLVEAGGIIFEGSNELHGVRNAGTNRATYYVLKWFPPGLVKAKAE
jgi:XRE family transcriptional regulator, regulator of sulfur utilization